MKTLYLLRHGQAPWSRDLPDDFARSLDAVGERQAASVGLHLAQAKVRPEMIIASPTDRTRQTARIVANTLSYPEKDIRYAPEIYSADVWSLARIVEQHAKSLNALLMVGHNPTLAHFGEWLTSERIGHLATCGLLAIHFNDDKWPEIGRGQGRLLWRSEDR
ncbi:MAG: histidine phosphatase family protein [Desulfobulbaceae bacterium]|jgi:phosphohistidine phosphatase|nr:histidine phosphatase family protein [Desulfobulbaceae bacterium]